MFDRIKYKEKALAQLKGQWKVFTIVSAISAALLMLVKMPEIISEASNHFPFMENIFHAESVSPIYGSGVILFFMFCALQNAAIFLSLKLAVEGTKVSLKDFFKGLEGFWKAFQAGFWMIVFITPWIILICFPMLLISAIFVLLLVPLVILFFVPVIVKFYSYSMTFFVLNEYPELGVLKSMKISKIMTKGYKGELFSMTLSFSGWIFLSLITGGIGFIFLAPYINLAFTNAYLELKTIALKSATLLQEDFESKK